MYNYHFRGKDGMNFKGKVQDIIEMLQYDDYLFSQIIAIWTVLSRTYPGLEEGFNFNREMNRFTGFFLVNPPIFNFPINKEDHNVHFYHNLDTFDNQYFTILKLKKYLKQACADNERKAQKINIRSYVDDVVEFTFYPHKIEEIHLLQKPKLYI